MQEPGDTIVAPATPGQPSARAVIRLSGPRAWEAALELASEPPVPMGSAARRQVFTSLLTKLGPVPALLLLFRAPSTATGEDTAEIHLPGNPILMDEVVGELARKSGCRLAAAGEFTRRAWENGLLSLPQAEALMALVSASDAGHARAAGQLLGGAWSRQVGEVLGRLEALCARLELSFDFDEEAAAQAGTLALQGEIEAVRKQLVPLAGGPAGESNAPVMVLAGPPNAGKSTLFNALCGRDVAAVSEEPGTTRDAVSAFVNMAGRQVMLVDTAGWDGPAETQKLGEDVVAATGRWEKLATVVVHCLPAGGPAGIEARDRAILVRTKSDLAPSSGEVGLRVSAFTGEGLEVLRGLISSSIGGELGSDQPVASPRMRLLLLEADETLGEAGVAAGEGAPVEVVSSLCRSALASLRDALGQGASADVLDAIFSRFCIGK